MKKSNTFFNKAGKNMTLAGKMEYVKNHYKYYRDGNIANNVKIWGLPLTMEQKNKAFEIYYNEPCSTEFYDCIESIIKDFEAENGCKCFFEGRSGGYLVITNKDNSKIGANPYYYDMYDFDNISDWMKFLKDEKEYTHREAQAFIREAITEAFDTVVAFDNLCDELLGVLIDFCENTEIVEEEYTTVHTCKVLAWTDGRQRTMNWLFIAPVLLVFYTILAMMKNNE